MYFRIIRNDVRQSKLITITTTIFVTVAALLVALATILSINLLGSIDTLLEKSEVAHYLQMHAGDLDEERMKQFVENNENIDRYEDSIFLNVEGSKIQIGDYNFSDSVVDNGLATQNRQLDYLLDLTNQPIKPKPGELYVPISLKKSGIAKIGDKVTIAGRKFKVNGFVRDGEMNSPMTGSKRFLVHQQDFDALVSSGTPEHLIQFRLKDLSKLNDFQSSYEKAGLEMNGPTVTHHLFRLASAISDGMLIAILLLVSLLVVLMTFMCIRFTLLAKIEADYQEIGVMKAIGMQVKEIKKIYVAKYVAISVSGSSLGYIISLPISTKLLENIKLNFGESSNEQLSKLLSIAGVLIVMLVLILYVSLLLNRFKKISAVEAIRFNGTNEKNSNHSCFNIRKIAVLSPNTCLAIIDIINRKKVYLTMLLVFIISSFIMIVPWMAYRTIADDSFIKFIGYSEEVNVITSLYDSPNSLEQEKAIEQVLEKDQEVADYNKVVTKSFTVKEANAEGVLRIELGNHQKFTVDYTTGEAPKTPNDIALSTINAEEYGKKVGDTLTILQNGKEKKLTVCGTYTNAFNGGKTAKASFEDENTEKMWTNIFVQLKPIVAVEKKADLYKKKLPFAKVNSVAAYREQTLGPSTRSIFLAAIGATITAVLITGLITSLFMKLLMTKDKREIATLKALGFTNQDLARQYLARSIVILLIGLFTGTLLTMTIGKELAAVLVSFMGLTSVRFSGNLLIYLGCPLLMILTTILATGAVTKRTGNIEIAENLKD
ncbi:ABC transporter permease [Candidatus Enterococcus ferrettii]|uniref:ABC3 transporter permease C-terminal domain-containing protein n=1 Tax=Candidatus Enterococcus ferrettii TaxID=2815324 RepID=A0ABV0EQ63_9ENTE|nr:FtsX-like permease family protein [Enterococcus sp. 665A]MBO1339287.1 FtsX-like permease family protein [Enterococcus sp. 665A]